MKKPITIDAVNLYRFKKMNVLYSDEKEIGYILERYIGLHAARIGTPYISLLNKGFNMSVNELYNNINNSKSFIKRRFMRKTLHICHVNDLDMLHYSTKKIRMPNVNIRYIEISKNSISEFLSLNNSSSISNLYNHVSHSCNVDLETAKLLLKYHYENGLIDFKNTSHNIYSEKREYFLLKNMTGIDLTIDMDEQFFIDALVLRYIIGFGPVTILDICWWTGISKRKITKAINRNKNELKYFFLFNTNIEMIIHKNEIDDIISIYNKYKEIYWCKFMSYEDSSLKAYYETRFMYIDNYTLYFNRIGEIYATILFNGKCIGIWEINKRNQYINCHLFKCQEKQIVDKERERMESLMFSDKQYLLLRDNFEYN